MTAASGADRVIAQTVDSAWRCDGCGERFTSLRVMGEHTCPASGADQPTLRDQLADPCGMRADGRPCPCCGDWPVTLPPGPCSCQPTHEIVIEVYEGKPAAVVRKPIAPPSAPHTPPRPDNYRPYA